MTKELCKHQAHKAISHIKAPKYSTDEILISAAALPENTNHVLIQFGDPGPKDKYGWFYMDAAMVRKHPQQKNGRTIVYVVPLSKREDFKPITNCEHEL